MRIADFEKAIDALDCDIELEEVKLSRGHVRVLYGRKDGRLLAWDSMGRCSSTQDERKKDGTYRRFIHKQEYDLKFDVEP